MLPSEAVRPGRVDRWVAIALSVTFLAVMVSPFLATPTSAQTGRSWGARPVRDMAAASSWRAADRRMLGQLPSSTRIALHATTGQVRFIGGRGGDPVARAMALRTWGRAAGIAMGSADETPSPGRAARAFVARMGPLFGVSRPGRDLDLHSTRRVGDGRSVVRFVQTRGGVPVLGGELVVNVDRRGNVVSASGEALPSADAVPTSPRISASAARREAAAWLARDAGVRKTAVVTRSEGLTILDQRILGGPALPGPRLVWSIDARTARSRDGIPAHQQVLVDARRGGVLESISRIAEGRERRICDFRSRRKADFRCRSPFTRVEGQGSTGTDQVDDAYRLMGVVDAFYRERFRRDGLDDRGSRFVATVRYCPLFQCPFPNAFWEWGPQQTAFGNGWASADDLVGHEFSHGVLDHEARLFYTYQSGALNEAFADAFGEFIDLTYAGGDDRTFQRWRIGEDLPGGVIRDLQDPGRLGHPDRVRSPRWESSSHDQGGVHINSMVGGKAASLITDGGSFNGYSIRGIGLARAAAIEYEAMSNHLTSASDYNDLFDALQQACTSLVGRGGITFAHCRSVRDAVRATEMDRRPVASGPRNASTCADGSRVDTVFVDDFEDKGRSRALWRSEVLHGDRKVWYYPPNPNNDADWDGTWASSGSYNLFAADRPTTTDSVMTLTTAVVLPARARLRFEHGFQFDASGSRRYDGGVLEISVDGGAWKDARPYFSQSGYNGTIAKGRGNRLEGRRAFTGASRGWGATRLDLSSLAGSTVRIRFRIATDRSSGDFGWYIDDVRFYRCVVDGSRPTGDISVDGGARATESSVVDVSVTARDTGSGLSRLRISNSSALSDGLLRRALEMDYRDTIRDWRLTDTAWGGRTGNGTKRVHVQVRDRAGNWSEVMSDAIVLE